MLDKSEWGVRMGNSKECMPGHMSQTITRHLLATVASFRYSLAGTVGWMYRIFVFVSCGKHNLGRTFSFNKLIIQIEIDLIFVQHSPCMKVYNALLYFFEVKYKPHFLVRRILAFTYRHKQGHLKCFLYTT
jgi:hypothetical protein